MSSPSASVGRTLGHRAPLLWIVVPMIAGLVAGKITETSASGALLSIAAIASVGGALTSSSHPLVFRGTLVCAMFLAGIASYAMHRPRIEEWSRLPPREAQLTIRIDRTFGQSDPRRFSGLGTITAADEVLQEIVGQRVYLPLTLRNAGTAPLRSASISVSGVIAALPFHPPVDTFDGYLVNAGINFRMSRTKLLAEVQPPTSYARFRERQAQKWRKILGAGVEQKRPELVAVYRAMLLGQQHELSDEHDMVFRQSGTMHVFSISGLHIGVIAAGLHSLLMVARLPRLVQFAAALVALWLYVDITGAAPSAVRAFLMIAVIELAIVLRVARNPLSALTVSVFVVLLTDPLQVFSASFQMSYGIVAALLLLGLPLADHWQHGLRLFRNLPKATWGPARNIMDVAWRATISATAIGVAASLIGAVTGVTFFKLITPGALMANLWVIPACTGALLMGLVSLLCGLCGFAAGSVLANHAAVLILWGIDAGIAWVVTFPGMWFNAAYINSCIGPLALAVVLATIAHGYTRNWQGWHRGYWAPFAVVAATFICGTKFG